MNVANMSQTWSLHPQLEGDTVAVGDLWLSRVLLSNDATIRGSSWCRGGPA